jgi:hypothetical protein
VSDSSSSTAGCREDASSSVGVTASVGIGGSIIVLVLFIVLVAIELLVPIATYMAALDHAR